MIAESYVTVDDADTYFSTRLNTDVWDNSTIVNKNKALITATRAIDNLNFIGFKTLNSQNLEFPRGGGIDIPDAIQIATCEIAIVLLDGFDVELERENLTSTSKGFASVRDTYDRTIAVEHLIAGIASHTAWDFLKPYLADTTYLNLSRVN